MNRIIVAILVVAITVLEGLTLSGSKHKPSNNISNDISIEAGSSAGIDTDDIVYVPPVELPPVIETTESGAPGFTHKSEVMDKAQGIKYVYDEDSKTYSANLKDAFGDIVIADSINGIKVTSVFSDAEGTACTSAIKSVVLPKYLLKIEDGAFYQCTGLEKVVLPEGLVAIGDEAFAFCSGLTELQLPASLTSIGTWAFAYCDNLSELVLSDNILSIGSGAFEGCHKLEGIKVPGSIGIIDYTVFASCYSLKDVVVSDGVASIMGSAFFDCGNLTTITIPDSVEEISGDTFDLCFNFKAMYVKKGSYAEKWVRANRRDITVLYY